MADKSLYTIPAVALRTHRIALEDRIVALEGERRIAEAAWAKRLAEITRTRDDLQDQLVRLQNDMSQLQRSREEQTAELAAAKDLEELRGRMTALQQERDALRAELDILSTSAGPPQDLEQELSVCRALSPRCIFIMGFARSSTTIMLEMLNTASNALLLGEANFFIPRKADRFRESYNDQHVKFRNQVTKSSYVPDFIPTRDHEWWEWLDGASPYFTYVGEKIAMSSYHLTEVSPESTKSFFESRFFTAKYIFMMRNPISALLSMAKLNAIDSDAAIVRECDAWLKYVELWADWIRILPNSITIIADDLDEGVVSELESFTGLTLPDAHLLLNPANKRQHRISQAFPTLARHRDALLALYADIQAAIAENRALWQAEQKRSAVENDSPGDKPGTIAMESRPLGRVWTRAQALRAMIAETGGSAA